MSSPKNTSGVDTVVSPDQPLAPTYDLTIQQKALAHEYKIDYNIHRAAKAVGMRPIDARGILSGTPDFKKYILGLVEEDSKSNLITSQYIHNNYLRIMPMLMGDQAVPLNVDGMSVLARQFNGPAALTALRDMAKSTNFVVAQEDASSKEVSVTVNIQNLTGE